MKNYLGTIRQEVGIGLIGEEPYLSVEWTDAMCNYYEEFPRVKVECLFSEENQPQVNPFVCNTDDFDRIYLIDTIIRHPFSDPDLPSRRIKKIGFISNIDLWDLVVEKLIPPKERDLYREFKSKGYNYFRWNEKMSQWERDPRFKSIDIDKMKNLFRNNFDDLKDDIDEYIRSDIIEIVEGALTSSLSMEEKKKVCKKLECNKLF